MATVYDWDLPDGDGFRAITQDGLYGVAYVAHGAVGSVVLRHMSKYGALAAADRLNATVQAIGESRNLDDVCSRFDPAHYEHLAEPNQAAIWASMGVALE